MTKPLKNVGTSVRTRLLQLAKQRGDDFQLVLLRYVNERLLHRLATSAHADRFVLKGAALFTVWTFDARPRSCLRIDGLRHERPGAQELAPGAASTGPLISCTLRPVVAPPALAPRSRQNNNADSTQGLSRRRL